MYDKSNRFLLIKEIKSTNGGIFITKTLPVRKLCGAPERRSAVPGEPPPHGKGAPKGRLFLFRSGREAGYFFRYLSSQPKNSRFQTIEFWGFMT